MKDDDASQQTRPDDEAVSECRGEGVEESSTPTHPDSLTPTPLIVPDDEARLLTPDEQQRYLALLTRAASPAGASAKLGLSLTSVVRTQRADASFRAQLDLLGDLMSQNVSNALYRAALKGNVTAQSFYLKSRPPPEWPQPSGARTTTDDLDDLNDAELVAHYLASGLALPPEAASLLDLAVGETLA